MKTLLERAKAIKIRRKTRFSLNREDVDLVVAYYENELNLHQIMAVKGFSGHSSVYPYINNTLIYGINSGLIEIIEKR